jgi:hypothetical protein
MQRELDYYSAAVCKRGHAETTSIEYLDEPPPERCSACGAEVLTACESCGKRIRGNAPGDWTTYTPPDFCDACAAPHPWLSRQGRIYLLHNLLDDEDLEPAKKLKAREQLDALINPDLDDEEQAQRWARFRKAAPSLWAADKAQAIITTILDAGTRALIDRYAP